MTRLTELVMSALLRLLMPEDPSTTDDSWDCYVERAPDGTVLETCERDLWPCHTNQPELQCTVRVQFSAPMRQIRRPARML